MNQHVCISGSNNNILARSLPVKCPFCKSINVPRTNVAIYKCIGYFYFANTCLMCEQSYLIPYNTDRNVYEPIEMPVPTPKAFKETIQNISANFVMIYNEAYAAEQMGLHQICGVGYRKALEFLVKDYQISKDEARTEEIKKKNLSQCIDEIEDDRIKQVAKRATWLGNDETHYVRKWEDRDVSHLKTLIDLCTNWMDAVITTEAIIAEMQ